MKTTILKVENSRFALGGLVLVLLFATFYALRAWVNLPVVQTSATSGDCVAVLYAEAGHSCENLPRRYALEYVAGSDLLN